MRLNAGQLIARLILDVEDTCCDIWYTFRPPADPWRLLGIAHAFRAKVPLPDGCDHRGVKVPQPDFSPMIGCNRKLGGCGAKVKAPCTTADGKVTRYHKIRTQMARKIEVESDAA